MKLVFATRNRGKIDELRDLVAGLDLAVAADAAAVEVVCAADLGVPDVVEDGATFEANAVKKAREVASATGLPALADDSGLEVDALGGGPGVYSARYAGEHGDDRANNTKLLAALAGVPPERRTARFRCVVALADPGGEVWTAHGVCEGVVLDAPRGEGGFGYDPLFFAPELGMTFAEAGIGHRGAEGASSRLGSAEPGRPQGKSGLSHRARAMRALAPRLAAYFKVAARRPSR